MIPPVIFQGDLKLIKMAKKFDRSIADAFATALDETEEWKVEFNLRELVEESFFSIEKARERKASWEQIAEILQGATEDNVEIKADTLRQYYFEALKIRDELAKQKRKKSSKKKTKSVDSTAKSSNLSQQDRQAVDQEISAKLEPQLSASVSSKRESEENTSSFNLRPS